MKRMRHEERTKLALEIIDQNRKTNSKLVGKSAIMVEAVTVQSDRIAQF
jgi:hypothetical protein